MSEKKQLVEVLILAVPETSGSALYGMVDVLMAVGNLWETMVREQESTAHFHVRIVACDKSPFRCGNRIPVVPDCEITEDLAADILILPELWLGPDDYTSGKYPSLMPWVRQLYRRGTAIYSACSGAILLAETGLLDGCRATSHWGYQDLFRQHFPKVAFEATANLVVADNAARIVTAGGTTSWHDLALHIIARHVSPGAAAKIARLYLLKRHGEGQLPYTALVRNAPHADSLVRKCQQWLADHYCEHELINRVVAFSGIPERSLKRRFKMATGSSLLEYVQNLRIEKAKTLLETSALPVDDISAAVNYEDPSFFRHLFKRRTGLAPAQYRRMFRE